MKEHKYRAWDTVKKIMYSAEELGADQETLSVDGRGFVNVSGDSTRLSEFHTHLLPLEYTGLKDKNGVEAYYADLCRDGFHNIWRIDWSIEYAGFELTLIEAGDKVFGEIDKLNICRVTDMEVIGNIYENPELPEGKK